MFVRTNGKWEKWKKLSVRVGSAWKEAKAVYVRVNGVWKKVTFRKPWEFSGRLGQISKYGTTMLTGQNGYRGDNDTGVTNVYIESAITVGATGPDYFLRIKLGAKINDFGDPYSSIAQNLAQQSIVETINSFASGKTNIRVYGPAGEVIVKFSDFGTGYSYKWGKSGVGLTFWQAAAFEQKGSIAKSTVQKAMNDLFTKTLNEGNYPLKVECYEV